MAVVLKLGVATLLRVTNCQKRVAKFDKKKKMTYIAENKTKIMVLTWYFSHLEGRKIFQKSLGVANQKSLRTARLWAKLPSKNIINSPKSKQMFLKDIPFHTPL